MCARLLVILCLVLSCPVLSAAATSGDSFTGFLTSVLAPNRFSVGPREVTWNPQTTRIYKLEGAEVDASATGLRVGARVHVEGTLNKHSGQFLASAIRILGPELKEGTEVRGIGLIEENAQLVQDGRGLSGILWVDGYPLHVTPQTKLLSADGQVFPASQIKPNLWASFAASRLKDDSIEATSITFEPNTLSADEVKYRDKSEPEIEQPDYAKHQPGTIKYRHQWMLNILPDEAVQQYVARVGESLIPQYQKELPTSDPTKINFQFYVVERPSKWKEVLNDASSSAGGVIVIPDNVLAVLDNESQLAALLSDCIAVTLEKQFYLHRTRLRTQSDIGLASELAGLYPPASLFTLPIGIGNTVAAGRLTLKINEQAARIGLRYMVRGGYDIREVPFAWTVAANQHAENPVKYPENPQEYDEKYGFYPPPLVASLMNDLYFDYSGVDYTRLRTGREDYRDMVTKLRVVATNLPKSKNYSGD